MDSHDAHPRTGRRSAAVPDAPPRRRRTIDEPVFDALVDPQDLFAPSGRSGPPEPPPPPSRKEWRTLEEARANARRREERRPGAMARRTALTFAGSGAA